MHRLLLRALICLFGILVSLAFGVLQPGARGAPQSPSTEERACRVLDVHVLNYKDKIYRIAIRLTEIAPYVLAEPRPGQPLRIEFARTGLDPSFTSTVEPNGLIEKVNAVAGDAGKLILEFPVAVSQVSVRKMELPTDRILVVDLELRPGVALPPTRTATGKEPRETPAAGGEEPLPEIALPVESARTSASIETALPELVPATRVTTEALPAEPGKPEKDPLKTALLDFPEAGKMRQAYEEKDYTRAFETGLEALRVPQPRESMETLLYLLAECRFELERKRTSESSTVRPAWPIVLNFYRQALRFSPESPFRSLIEHRVAQVYGLMGQREEEYAELTRLWKRLAKSQPPPSILPSILMEAGMAALDLHTLFPRDPEYLRGAEEAFEAFAARFPKDPQAHKACILRGETCYQQSVAFSVLSREYYDLARQARDQARQAEAEKDANAAKAYTQQAERATRLAEGYLRMSLEKETQTLSTLAEKEISTEFSVVFEHAMLAASHRSIIDLVHPDPADKGAKYTISRLAGSLHPDVCLEYARILEKGGDRVEAMRQYNRLLRDFTDRATPKQIVEARRGLARFALQDTLAGRKDPTISYEDYVNPLETLKELYDGAFDFALRAELQADLAGHLIAQGRQAEAIGMVLPYLKARRLPPEVTRELTRSIWDIFPRAVRECREQGDGLLALQTYGNFAQFLQDHPARNDLILESARILMELDQRQGAEKALMDLGPAASLGATQQDKLNRLKQELALDPADPVAVKRDAPALLGPEYEDTGRARAIRLLAQVHASEGNHEQAAQEYLSATDLKNLSWRERVRFCQNAAREYGLADKPAKILEAAEQGLKDIQSAGVPLVETGASGGNLLLLKAENLTRLGDYPNSAIAYQQYLDLFPTAAEAPLARYSLARAYELGNEREKALKEYERLAQSKEDPFWSQTARGTADQLRWEVEHPYVIRKEATP